ncbi:MAG: CBS domain-containing protein [Methanosarcinaceae archaeon]|nr:CBS domain-containing protein [Methanosarcinaceae archaeon]
MIAENMLVKDVMTRGVVTVPLDASAANITKAMAENDVSAIVAVDGNGEAFGMISEMDVLKEMRGKDWKIETVEDLMAASVETVKPSTTVRDAADIMVKKHIHRLIVMSEDNVGASNRPIGVLSANDIIRELCKK